MVIAKMMKMRGGRCATAALVVAAIVAACDDSSGPNSGSDTLPEDQLDFVPIRAAAPPLATLDTSFWAVRGENRRLEIRFAGQGGPGTGSRFLELEVDDESLLRRPDGTPFAEGDSIEITVTIDPGLYRVDCGPSGLVFSAEEPAELEIEYGEADEEFLAIEAEFDVWRQEQVGEPWRRLASVQLEDQDEIDIEVFGFTRFALAVGR